MTRLTGILCATMALSAAEPAGDVFQAIRAGDIPYLKSHLSDMTLEARDRRGATPLLYAAAFGNVETLRLLLDRGAAVNAANDFAATALLWGARDPERVTLLVEHGANVNARSKQGRTPLMLASLRPGGSSTVALLLGKGADAKIADGRGNTALHLAATIGEVETMRLLLGRGAVPDAANDKGETPLICATKSHNAEAVRLLLQKGVKVNVANTFYNKVKNGQIALLGITPLHRAAAFGPVEMVRDLLKAGADPNVRDSRGFPPLIFAVATDEANPEIVRALLRAGADVKVEDHNGESAFDWAAKFGDPGILAQLREAGGRAHREYQAPKLPEAPRPDARTAVARSMALLEKNSGEFFRQSGCVACHHQPLIARAQLRVRSAGVAPGEAAAREQTAQMKGQWLALQEEFLQSINPAGGSNRMAEQLLGLEGAEYPPDSITDSAAVDLMAAQSVDGRWMPGDEHPRPPILGSAIAATARTVRAIQAYSPPARRPEVMERVAKARAWLARSTPETTDDYTLRLLGLLWSGAPAAEVRAAARGLAALQRGDGGWAGNPHLKSDAYSTGGALTALADAGMEASDTVYRRGVDYLLATQFPDGAWHVRSRTMKFQPYFESGFPFGHDQWISAAATAWAAQAIAHTIPTAKQARAGQ